MRPKAHIRAGGGTARSAVLLGILLGSAIPAYSQALIRGLVETIEDDRRRPAADAVVRAFLDEEAIASARSDREGRYELEVPAESFELRAVKPGYVVAQAAGLNRPSVPRACPKPGDCGAVDFLLERAAAVEVWLADPSGDPFPAAQVELTPLAAQGEPARKNETDDRGVARFHGLAPGRYHVDIRPPALFPASGSLYEIDRTEVELYRGENAPLYRSARRAGAGTFSLSASIEGIDFDRGRYWLQVRPLRGGLVEGWGMMQNGPEVELSRLVRGDYVFELTPRGPDGAGPTVLLGRVQVDDNVSGLALRPRPAPKLLVHVLFEDGAPDAARLALESEEGWTWVQREVQRGAANIAIDDAPPGRYRLAVVRTDGFLLEKPAVHLAEGASESLRVTLSARFARIRGTIRGADGAPVRVELSGPTGASDRVAGPNGAFAFDKLAPGEYSLCTNRAGACQGDKKRRFAIEPGDDIEIELGAPQ